jgi:tRNA (mo5U34)-methyltransferase
MPSRATRANRSTTKNCSITSPRLGEPGGIVTPGIKTLDIHRIECAAFFDPIEVNGCSVIDIGAWNGAYSFEAKRRGAARVLATDHVAWTQMCGRDTFELARSALNLDIEAEDIDIPDVSVERLGTFDVVLFLGVFYHLFDPIAGLEKVAKLARESLIIETHTDGLAFDRPAMAFYPGSELANDASNWWGPNPALMVALLKKFGFAKVDAAWSIRPRAVFHAWRTDSLRRSSDINEHTMPALKRRQKLHRGWRLIREGLGLRRMS